MSNNNNPISEPQTLRARLGKPRPVPQPGVTQVFINRRGDFVITEGKWPLSVGEWIAGRSWTMHEVNVGDNLLEFECELPCQQDIGHFRARVCLVWRVSDALEVVKRYLVDVRGELEPWVQDRMRRMTTETDVRHRAETEAVINDELGKKPVPVDDLGLEICRFKVTLDLDETARKHVDRITAIEREKEADEHEQVLLRDRAARKHVDRITAIEREKEADEHEQVLLRDRAARKHVDRITAIEREKEADEREQVLFRDRMEFYRKAVAGGHHELILLRLARRPEDIPAILQMLREEDGAAKARILDVFKAMLDAGVLEDFEIDKTRVEILKRVVDDMQASVQSRSLMGDLPQGLPEPEQSSADLDDGKTEGGEQP
ncbi:MAG: hypothetical protein ACRDTT_07970 [Pseudonocardiaceae bacterium]